MASDDIKVRTELYVKYLGPAFDEMVDKIIYTYRFTSLPNIDVLKDECKIWLTTILDKYDPSKGSKAFSYFNVVAKNFLIIKSKQKTAFLRRSVSIEDERMFSSGERHSYQEKNREGFRIQ